MRLISNLRRGWRNLSERLKTFQRGVLERMREGRLIGEKGLRGNSRGLGWVASIMAWRKTIAWGTSRE